MPRTPEQMAARAAALLQSELEEANNPRVLKREPREPRGGEAMRAAVMAMKLPKRKTSRKKKT